MLSVDNTTTGNFCLAHACNYETENDIAQWGAMVRGKDISTIKHFTSIILILVRSLCLSASRT